MARRKRVLRQTFWLMSLFLALLAVSTFVPYQPGATAFFFGAQPALAAPLISHSAPFAASLVVGRQHSDEPENLIIPVAGVRASELRDTFNTARSEGRTHNAMDILAPRGTPVLAAAAGEVARLFFSERGGITVYQFSTDRKFVFYYAHLERYAEGLAAGQKLRQGEVLGYVGDTGNAGAGNYHLHFSIWRVTDPKRYWEGINLNPYPLLRPAAESTRASRPRRVLSEEKP